MGFIYVNAGVSASLFQATFIILKITGPCNMKAVILTLSFLLVSYGIIHVPTYSQSKDKTFSLNGEWERVGNPAEGNIGKIIFYPDGTLNVINTKNTEVRVLRYRLLAEADPWQGEILTAPFGLGVLKDRVAFTIHINSPNNINFTYTTKDKSQTIFLKKIREIPHGIVPLSR